MIAADSSSLIAYLSGAAGVDVDTVDRALGDEQLCLPPVVLTELLSDPKLPKPIRSLLMHVPMIELTSGYWDRAGELRAKVIARNRRARLADTLIAQSCLDFGVALITRDTDFAAYAQIAGLELVLA